MRLAEILADWVVFVIVGFMWLVEVLYKWFKIIMFRVLYSLGRMKVIQPGYTKFRITKRKLPRPAIFRITKRTIMEKLEVVLDWVVVVAIFAGWFLIWLIGLVFFLAKAFPKLSKGIWGLPTGYNKSWAHYHEFRK